MLKRVFPPVVTGVTIFLIGASLITAGIQNWGGAQTACLTMCTWTAISQNCIAQWTACLLAYAYGLQGSAIAEWTRGARGDDKLKSCVAAKQTDAGIVYVVRLRTLLSKTSAVR